MACLILWIWFGLAWGGTLAEIHTLEGGCFRGDIVELNADGQWVYSMGEELRYLDIEKIYAVYLTGDAVRDRPAFSAGVEMIDGSKVSSYEPNVKADSALYVPTSGILEPTVLVDKLYRLAVSCGVMFLVGNEVAGIRCRDKGVEVEIRSDSGGETFKTGILINSAGLYSDDIARMINPSSPYTMDPVGGEWARFYKTRRDDIFMNGLSVYPVPSGYLPDGEKLKADFKEFRKQLKMGKVHKSTGIHLTPSFEIRESRYVVGDTVIVGPAYTKPEGREDYSQKRSQKYYLEMVMPFFPNLRLEDLGLHQAGIRAKLKDYYDFIIERDPVCSSVINLIGIDSPGLTSSLAIAKYVKRLVESQILQ